MAGGSLSSLELLETFPRLSEGSVRPLYFPTLASRIPVSLGRCGVAFAGRCWFRHSEDRQNSFVAQCSCNMGPCVSYHLKHFFGKYPILPPDEVLGKHSSIYTTER